MATPLAVLALYDGGVTITTTKIKALLEATRLDDVEAYWPIKKPGVLVKLIAVLGVA